MSGVSTTHNEEGKVAFKGGEYARAIECFSLHLMEMPADATVLANRSFANLKLARPDAAAADATAAIAADPSFVKGHYRLASALVALHRGKEAVAAVDTALALKPSPAVKEQLTELRQQAVVLAASGEEIANASRAADEATTTTDIRMEDVSADGGTSTEQAEESDKMARKRAEAHKEAGNVAYKRGRYDAAVQEYAEAMALDPENATYCCNRAAALLMLEQAQPALLDAQRALALDPTLLKAHSRAFKSLVQLGQLSHARRQLEQAVDRIDGANCSLQSEHALLNECDGLLRNGKNALALDTDIAAREAAHLFSNLANKCPCSVAIACLQMEAILRSRPRQGPPQVLSESARWMRKHDDQPDLLCVRGKALYGTGQLEQALKHFAEALRLDPDHTASRKMRVKLKEIEATKARGNEAFQSRRYDEAIAAYSETMLLDPDNVDLNLTLYTNRATAKFKAGDFLGCVSDCDAALNLQPQHIKALLRRGAARLELEEYKAAISDYEQAEQAEPNDAQIKQGLRRAKLELKKSLRKDLYKLLGVTKHASDMDIKKGYKKAALQWHPDRHHSSSDEDKAHAEIKFKEIGEAFEVLSDPKKKRQYDEGADLDEINGNGGGG
eukprot:CAMPEP_0119378592 /NCGR_PEP_ID=MMETSP1334-20130426/49016_1 /TAXON_ID=127549 /ORGANISM="Calcidiscus leptoporus, Strain RCC1130" /LENGTH=615 /DNA_ID=CAMNT_0007397857 /DNA_START=63 /DNA_END=1906 /DNA_ORIENTATION=+